MKFYCYACGYCAVVLLIRVKFALPKLSRDLAQIELKLKLAWYVTPNRFIEFFCFNWILNHDNLWLSYIPFVEDVRTQWIFQYNCSIDKYILRARLFYSPSLYSTKSCKYMWTLKFRNSYYVSWTSKWKY